MRLCVSLACALAACAVDDVGTTAQPITSGTPTSGDPAVFALADDSDRVSCTASVIGPHTAITAAHCVADLDLRPLRAVFGASVADGTAIEISDARMHPMFDRTVLAHDLAMLTLREMAPAPPLELDTRTIDSTLVGTELRVVGFGSTAIAAGDSGTKREGTARISAVSADELTAVPDPSQPCRGDSGGPALLSPTSIAAVVSRGDAACSDHATFARIDVAREVLVDPYLADTAPGTAPLGDVCLYDGHCAEGACLPSTDDPMRYVCAVESDAGCGGCASDSRASLWLGLVVLLGVLRRRRALGASCLQEAPVARPLRLPARRNW